MGASITTAKSSEINVLVPGSGADCDWVSFLFLFHFLHVIFDYIEFPGSGHVLVY